jgi:uncharacterized protein YpmS
MKIILHLVTNILLLIMIVVFLNKINSDYLKSSVEVASEIKELSKKIKSGEEVLSPLQYSEILDIANDRLGYHFSLNVFTIISLFFYIVSIFTFYIGIFIGRKSTNI